MIGSRVGATGSDSRMPPSAETAVMDRRVLFATLILFAGGATGVGVAAFAFVGLDDPTPEATVVWESEPPGGDVGGTGVATATVDGDTVVLQPTVADGNRAVRALNPGDGTAWTTPIPAGSSETGSDREPGGDPVEASGLTAGTLDGDPVVALTTADGRLVVLNAADGSERFVVDLGGPGGLPPAIGDPTGGEPVVAAATTDGTVIAVDGDGDAVFETALEGAVDGDPVIVAPDPDPDGEVDRVAGGVAVLTGGSGSGSASGSNAEGGAGTVHFLGADGDARWTATPSVTTVDWTASATRRGPVLALGGANGNFEALEAADGSTRYDIGLQDRPVAVGDAGDGRVRVGGVGSVWAVSLLDGEVVWKQQYGGETRVNAPRLGDVSGDERAETVTVNRRGDVLATNRNGEAVVQGGVDDAVVYADPSFADATGDGSDEIVVTTEDGVVRALETQ